MKYLPIHIIIMLLLSACSSVKIIAEQEESFDQSTYRTYAFAPVDMKQLDPATAVLYEEISKTIAREMKEKGYTVDTEAPDLLVAFNILTEESRKEVWRNNNNMDPWMSRGMWPYSPWGWGPNFNDRYKEIKLERTGTFVVDLLSTEQKDLVWRGIGIGPVNDPEERFDTAYRSVQKMFKKLPAQRG
ncbi:MAG: DUF4136 domain-containing protein [Cyclobacteriaceae bacterium]